MAREHAGEEKGEWDPWQVEVLQVAQEPEKEREEEKDDQLVVVGADEEQKHEKQVEGKKDEWKNEGRANYVNWTKQCSKHLCQIEGRLMEQAYLAHEVLRQVRSSMRQWSPLREGSGAGF